MRASRLKRLFRNLATRIIGSAFAAVGFVAWLLGDRPAALDPTRVQKILVIRLDLLGDIALSMPAVRALRRRYPSSQLDMLVLPYTAPLVPCYDLVDHLWTFDINALRPSGDMFNRSRWGQLLQLIRELRARRYDLAISLYGCWGSALAFSSGARFRVGYAGESFRFMHNLPVPGRRYRERRHELEYCLDLARAAGATVLSPEARPILSAESVATAASLLDEDPAHGRPRVAIHVGALNGGAKRWTAAGWAEVAQRLTRERSAQVIFIGTERERQLIDAVLGQMAEKPLVLAGRTPIPVLLAVLKRCDVLLSGDSGPLHLAMGLGVLTVAVHGPSDPALSGPYGAHARIVRHDLPCSPCYDLRDAAECWRGDHACMNGISADEVYCAAVEQLERSPRRPSIDLAATSEGSPT